MSRRPWRSQPSRAPTVLFLAGVLAVGTDGLLLPRAVAQATPSTLWVSAPAPGIEPSILPGASTDPSISSDGAVVAFSSTAGNLVSPPAAGRPDVYAYDARRPSTSPVELVSVGTDGRPAPTGASTQPSTSFDGSVVAFASQAVLDPTDTDGRSSDVYVRDRLAGTTELVSGGIPNDPPGLEVTSPAISADGRYVAMVATRFTQTQRPPSQVYVFDRVELATKLVSHGPDALRGGDADSFGPSISLDGGVVAFASRANLTPRIGEQPGGGGTGAPPPARIFIWQRTGDAVSLLSEAFFNDRPVGACGPPSLSFDARRVAYACRYRTGADFEAPSTTALRPAQVDEGAPVPGRVFVTDRLATGTTTQLASVSTAGVTANGDSCGPSPTGDCTGRVSLSGSGAHVAFSSTATNLLSPPQAPDTNGVADVFVRNLTPNATATFRVSVTSNGAQVADGASTRPSIATTGRAVAFVSTSRTLTANRCSGTQTAQICDSNVFLRDDPVLCPCPPPPPPPPRPIAPSLRVAPGIVAQGRVALAEGTGFRPSTAVRLTFDTAELRPIEVTTTPNGTFRAPVVIPQRFQTGPRAVAAQSANRAARAAFLVVRRSAQPPFGDASDFS